MKCPPVALAWFNRPGHAARVLNAVRQARPRALFVFADAPRPGKPGDAALCAATRALLDTIDWPCDIHADFADEHLGCRRRMASGITWVFDHTEAAIILEDDCLPAPSFFPFCAELLERFAEETRVAAVCGAELVRPGVPLEASYRFSRYPVIWGWATWRRMWRLYDPELAAWPMAGEDPAFFGPLAPEARAYWSAIFDKCRHGFNTWDYQFTFAAWRAGALSVHPCRNLIANIGFGPEATHTFDPRNPFANLPLETMDFPLVHPDTITAHNALDAELEARAFSGHRHLEDVFAAVRSRLRAARAASRVLPAQPI